MNRSRRKVSGLLFILLFFVILGAGSLTGLSAEEAVVIGLNYPETGPYAKMGLDQRRAADLAVEEINGAGGILGKTRPQVHRDDAGSRLPGAVRCRRN